jgi:multiple sugar transport system permease protein
MALAVAGFFMLLPFGWMVLTSLTPESEVVKGGLPSRLTLQNFIHVLDTVPIGRYYVNGLIVTISTFLAQTLVCVPAAFALARIRFVGARAGLWTVLGCLMVPPQVVALPVYVFLSQLGLLDTRTGLVIPFIGSAFGVFLLRQFFLTIPQSVIDAAKLDGAGTVAMLWRILVPMSRPALVSFGIFSVVAHWNDLFWPLFVLRSTEHATVPYGIVEFISIEAGSQYGAQMAASVMAVAPLLVGFLVAQRQLIEGVALSGSQE